MPLGVRRDDRDLVLRGVEADAGRTDVVDDDGVEVLARELLAPVRDRPVAVLGGEADEQLAGAAAGGERRRARPVYARDAARVPRRPRPS